MRNKISFHVSMLCIFVFLLLAQATCYVCGGFTTFGLTNLLLTFGFFCFGTTLAVRNIRRLRDGK
jgi:hypothetical protein